MHKQTARMRLGLRAAICAAGLLALLLVRPAPAPAAPFTTVLNGGKITYEGSMNSSRKYDEEDFKYNENTSLSWSTTYPVQGLYEDSPIIWNDDYDLRKALSWTESLGTTSSYINVRYWDSQKGHYWDDNTCSATAHEDEAPNPVTPPEETPTGNVFTIDGTDAFDWRGTCADPDGPGTPNSYGDGLFESIAKFKAGKTPHVGSSWVQNHSFSATGKCPEDSATNCTRSFDGGGTVKLECLLCVTDVKLQHPDVPNGALVDVPASGTTDGNPVRITLKIANTSNRTWQSVVDVVERKSKRKLFSLDYGTNMPITFPAGATTTITFDFNTNGFAWEKGQPMPDRELDVLTALGGARIPIKVNPRPMILVHGWNSVASTWEDIKPFVPTLHPGYQGRVFAVGDNLAIGTMNTDPDNGWPIERNANALKFYIEDVRADLDAQAVDLVVHSMGGLISRVYIQEQMPEPFPFNNYDFLNQPVIRHLVMLGTPNRGSPCADYLSIVMKGTPTWQLRTDFARDYLNKNITNRRGVPMSVLAGNWKERTCTSPKHGDLVVEVESAWSDFTDIGETYITHLGMTSSESIFSSWVKDRVALDPEQSYNPSQMPPELMPPNLAAPAGKQRAAAAAAAAAEADPSGQVSVAEKVTVPANGQVDVPIAVGQASAVVAGFVADANVASQLLDPSGAVVGAAVANSDAAQQPLRFHRAESPAAGTWILRLSQAGGTDRTAAVIGAVEGSPLTLAATAQQAAGGGPIAIDATLSGGTGTVRATIRGDDIADIALDLTNLGGGRYGASSAALPAGNYRVEVVAQSGGETRFAGANASAGAVVAPPPGPDPGPGNSSDGNANPGGNTDVPHDSSKPPTPTIPVTAKPVPRRVTAKVVRARDRRAPFRWTVTGRVLRPTGSAAGACEAGTVLLVVVAGRRPVGTYKAKVGRTCRFATTIKVRGKKKGRMTIRVRFMGARGLQAKPGPSLSVRAG